MLDKNYFVASANAHLTLEQYRKLYQQSLASPDTFWNDMAEKFITWFKPCDTVFSGSFEKQNSAWFVGAQLNAAYNCLDRHLEKRANQIAIIWEGDDSNAVRHITYAQLFEEVCRFANVLKSAGVKKGDCVGIYLPMIPETAVAMLACARIGAMHSVVFAGFSAEALEARLTDAKCKLIITANESIRGNKIIPLKKNVDAALLNCPEVKRVIVVARTQNTVPWQQDRDNWYHDLMQGSSSVCAAEIMDAQDPLFVLYTSGSTGKPKGILHSTGGYLVYAAVTHFYIFDYHDKDVYWCTADVGWITGHTYLIYGPLLNGATTLMFEGVPNYPSYSRFWEMIDRHQVNIFYTAPTAIRALRREGDEWVTKTKRTTLKLLGTVGEPISPDVWEWYFNVVGGGRCPVVDTWWQTETGGIMISAIPYVTPPKPGSAAWPFFGVEAAIVDDEGHEAPPGKMGKLIIKRPWPGMLQTIFNNPERFKAAYFNEFPQWYFTGDDAKCDEQGYFWITGRNDDVLKLSGHRVGTGEIESALLKHGSVSEAAAVGVPNVIKGQSIYLFVTLKSDVVPSDALKKELIQQVRSSIGPIATPDFIQWTDDLPKTRSGKILRRLLRKIATNDFSDLGDTSTLSDPQIMDNLIKNRIITDK